MNIVMYIVLLIVLAFTVYNFIATSSVKGRNKANRAKYNALFAPVEEALLEEQKRRKCCFGKVVRILNDREQPIVVVRDDTRRIGAIAMKDFLEVFSFDDVKNARIENDGRNNASVKVQIREDIFTFDISTKGYSKHSFTGKLCRDMANWFVEALDISKLDSKKS